MTSAGRRRRAMREVPLRAGGPLGKIAAGNGRPIPPPFTPPPPGYVPEFKPKSGEEDMPTTPTFVSSERVKLKSYGSGRGKPGFRLSLPGDLTRQLGQGIDGLEFRVELCEEGILFRPAGAVEQAVALPSWVPKR